MTQFTHIFIQIFFMNKKDQLLTRLQTFKSKQILAQINTNNIIQYFEGFQHQDGLLLVDSQMLQIIYEKMMEGGDSQRQQESQNRNNFIKTDILNEGIPNLLAYCNQKRLIDALDYIMTIKNKSHKSHSYYGYRLVNNFPEEFYIGPRCTHYHCKTTARKIQQQYGIYNPKEQSRNNEKSQPDYSSPQDADFVVADSKFSSEESDQFEGSQQENSQNDDNQSEQEQNKKTIGKKSRKLQKISEKMDKQKKKQKEEDEEMVSEIGNFSRKRRRKLKDFLNSDSEQKVVQNDESSEQIVMKRRPKQNISKNQYQKTADVSQKRLRTLKQLISSLKEEDILNHLGYKVLFEYLFQEAPDLLAKSLDREQVLLIIQTNKTKKKKPKKLNKSKINIKSINMDELIQHCKKLGIQLNRDPQEYNPKDHVKLGKKLVKLFPKRYQQSGEFQGYNDYGMNKIYQEQYKRFQFQQDFSEESQQFIDDQQFQSGRFDYSVQNN